MSHQKIEKLEETIELEFLDHVAIRVKDLKESAAWYSKVLGLKEYQLKKWGEYPIFMISKNFGVALFPANLNDEKLNPNSKNIKIDHFAFNVNTENFEKAIKKYTELGLKFKIQDHFYFDSIYTSDPSGHTVELTTIKVKPEDFYNL